MNSTQILSFANACILCTPDKFLEETNNGFQVTTNSAKQMSPLRIFAIAQNCLDALKTLKDSKGIDSLIKGLKNVEQCLKNNSLFKTIYSQAQPFPFENLPLVLWKKIAEFHEPKEWASQERVAPVFKTNLMKCKIWQSEVERRKLEKQVDPQKAKDVFMRNLFATFNEVMMKEYGKDVEKELAASKKSPIASIADPYKKYQAISDVLYRYTPSLARGILEDILQGKLKDAVRTNIYKGKTEFDVLFGFKKLISVAICSQEWFVQNLCYFWSFNGQYGRKEIIRALLQKLPTMSMPYSYALMYKYFHMKREDLDIDTAMALLNKCTSINPAEFQKFPQANLGIQRHYGESDSLAILAHNCFSTHIKWKILMKKMAEKGDPLVLKTAPL